jgi:hypothetical protein
MLAMPGSPRKPGQSAELQRHIQAEGTSSRLASIQREKGRRMKISRMWVIPLILTASCYLYSTTRIGLEASSSVLQSAALREHVRVKENVFVSDERPKLTLTLDAKFKYLGSFPFDIRGIAGGYRYIWGEMDHDKHLGRAFIVQAEGYYPNNNGKYVYGTPNAAILAGEAYQHNVFIYDNDESTREGPGNEADLTKKFMQEHGYEWGPELIMSRFARAVGETKKDEIIFFYFEDLKNYTSKHVKDFPEGPHSAEQQTILDSVDANSRKAFTIVP